MEQKGSLIILIVVVDDLMFAANNQFILECFKTYLSTQFDVKMYGTLKSFIRWRITCNNRGIKTDQTQ